MSLRISLDAAVIVVGWDWLMRHTQESGEYYRRKAETRLLLGIPSRAIINYVAASLTVEFEKFGEFGHIEAKRPMSNVQATLSNCTIDIQIHTNLWCVCCISLAVTLCWRNNNKEMGGAG